MDETPIRILIADPDLLAPDWVVLRTHEHGFAEHRLEEPAQGVKPRRLA